MSRSRIEFLALSMLWGGACHEPKAKPLSVVSTPHNEAPAQNDSTMHEDSIVPQLSSYSNCVEGKDYWLEMKWVGDELAPVEVPAMPMHHASRLEFENQEEFHTKRGSGSLKVTFRMLSNEVLPVPGRNAWRATYRARILKVEAWR
jgi:hypothetical protein